MPSLASVFTQGTAARHDLNQYYAAQIPPGHTIGSIVISPSLATGMSIDLVTEDVVYDGSGPTFVPSVDQTVTVTTVPAAGLTLLQDWNNRIGAPGVVWAQRFLSQTDVNRGVSGGGHTSQQWVSNDGIMSDGCLSQGRPC